MLVILIHAVRISCSIIINFLFFFFFFFFTKIAHVDAAKSYVIFYLFIYRTTIELELKISFKLPKSHYLPSDSSELEICNVFIYLFILISLHIYSLMKRDIHGQLKFNNHTHTLCNLNISLIS